MVTRVGRDLAGSGLLAAGCGASLAAGLLVVRAPLVVAAGAVALVFLTVLVLRLDLAVLLYVAVEPFGDLLPDLGGTSVVRLVGATLFGAWLVRWVLDSRPLALRHRVVGAAATLLLVLLASLALNPNDGAGLAVAGRYVSYLAVLVVLLDSMRHRVDPWQVARVLVWSCTAAAAVGLAVFVREGGRAHGPQQDPNDLAFFLITAVPFAVASMHGSRARRVAYGLAAAVLLLGTAATFSRGAALGLAVGVVVALLVGLVRLRHVVVGGAVTVLGGLAVWASVPGIVERSITEKQTVAQANIDSRFASWEIAARITADHPVLGSGPGGYRTHFASYEARATTDPRHLDVAHQMFLDVSSELGLLGLAAFAALLGLAIGAAWRAAFRAPGPDPAALEGRRLGAAVLTAFTTTLVAALFLSEQYYLPLWLLVALGAAIDPRWVRRRPDPHPTQEEAPCASSS